MQYYAIPNLQVRLKHLENKKTKEDIIVMTSNLGAGPVKSQTRQLVMGAIRAHFPPEFINRIDETIILVST